ncbi:MAG: type II toxin-antitoxin system RelE/ParE family toxin [Fusobacterium sp.]|uniref:type II toxin-antitoxin system RelE family toxin n=1 Tax=Fusobacterium sp. TaxID=68766 RepID=UPI0026DC8CC1|nr:type II toxin-antitoxin system RelE/ParE family toxin [Fusobacterium sp.]MDO4691089.1 type II toxin-antitoxin system RelE/ParE family toxin [Fusobacterium sp.]
MNNIKLKIDFIYRKPAKNFFKKHNDVKEKFKNNIISKFKGQTNIDIIKMSGYPNLFRMRIGSYRIIYKIENNEIILIDVLDADNRGDIY